MDCELDILLDNGARTKDRVKALVAYGKHMQVSVKDASHRDVAGMLDPVIACLAFPELSKEARKIICKMPIGLFSADNIACIQDRASTWGCRDATELINYIELSRWGSREDFIDFVFHNYMVEAVTDVIKGSDAEDMICLCNFLYNIAQDYDAWKELREFRVGLMLSLVHRVFDEFLVRCCSRDSCSG